MQTNEITESRQVCILPLSQIQPAPQNDTLYKPIDPNAPETKALAASIREHGILDPLLVTSDYVLVSGHRRRVAAKLIGLRKCPACSWTSQVTTRKFLSSCASEPAERENERGTLREEVVSIDPKQAHRRLVEYREERHG